MPFFAPARFSSFLELLLWLQIGVVLLPFMNRLLIDLELPRIMRDQKQHMRKLPRDKRCLLPKHMESAANMAKELRNWREVVSFSRKGIGIVH
ncbi:uncharacterized protein DS421_20g688910 [Arachis hypogaea]|nr:uncharacterized protein DS421_20g688910 [Arachis hypogaea]